MTQAEIFEFLLKNTGKFTAKEICLNLKMEEQAVWANLRRLKEVEHKGNLYWINQ